ncbi:glutamine synthetase [Streptomyces sp. NBC_01089]|nr:glutamine synthetase [Streptomyces sp. NBC_01089]
MRGVAEGAIPGPSLGRRWAVRGRPVATNNDRQRPSRSWSVGFWAGQPQAAGSAHQFLRNKKQEWEEYRSEVTAFELRKNLPVL